MSAATANPGQPSNALAEALATARSAMKVVAIFSLVINVLMLTIPIYMLQVYDRVLGSGSVETLVLLTLMAAVALLVMSILDTLRNSVTVRIGCWFNDRLGPVYFESGVAARLKGQGNGAEPLRDLSSIQGFIATQGLVAFFDMPWVPIFIAIIWLLHPMLGVLALISAIVLLLLSFANDWVTRRPTKFASEVSQKAIRIADATIRNSEAVRAMGFLPAMIERWRVQNSAAIDAMRGTYEAGGVVMAVTKFVRFFVQVAILGLGAWLVLKNELTPGAMIAGSILLGRALAPVEMAIGAWKNFMQARLAYDRLKEQLEKFPLPVRRTILPVPQGHLEVSDLAFAAPGGSRMILNRVSFAATPGEAIAVIGPSGAGKSTLCRLICGLAAPAYGEIRIDGSDVRHWDVQQLGQSVGYLPQDVELFEGTIRDNIARMGPATDEEVIAAAVTANAHHLIQQLPQGYDTEIGDGGVRLSGGQRQRIGLARAVFGNPNIIVLDEPNANLDQAGEQALADAIANLKQEGRLLIIVGHRPSTLAQADKVLVVKDGFSAMFGPRDEVLRVLTEGSQTGGSHEEAGLTTTNGATAARKARHVEDAGEAQRSKANGAHR
jgi:ATP-binding cassette subfamily C protein/ATP-binding cassette subfamily C exporter for protease/lipase/ATP-binding cassette subfamily C protein EexD